MGGRADYEERKQRRIERYEQLSIKARNESEVRGNSTANRILRSTPGQPILVGHHSEKAHRRLIKRANDDIRKSIELSEKSDYYERKAKKVVNSNAIYNDDPEAINKLKEKVERLEKEREEIKKRKHFDWELRNIGATIRETKMRIDRLEELEKIEFPNICFSGGKAVHNKEKNRIQIFFNNIPNEEIRENLFHNGFKWARSEGAWQRQFNKTSIWKTKEFIKFIESAESNKKEEEEEIQ